MILKRMVHTIDFERVSVMDSKVACVAVERILQVRRGQVMILRTAALASITLLEGTDSRKHGKTVVRVVLKGCSFGAVEKVLQFAIDCCHSYRQDGIF